MDSKQLLSEHLALTSKLHDLTKRKNSDYAGQGNAFNNFMRIESISSTTSAEQGFLSRMSDKLARFASFIDSGELLVKDESVDDTLEDLANYALLARIYVEWKRKAMK